MLARLAVLPLLPALLLVRGDPSRGDALPNCTPRVATVALVGDSTFYGYDGHTKRQATTHPGVVLQAAMDRHFGAGAVVVMNHGVPGTKASEAPVVRADVVVVNYGINDAAAGVPLSKFKAAMVALAPTIYQTPNPVPAPSLSTWPVWAFAQATREAAAATGAPVADVWRYVAGRPEYRRHFGDGIHPNAELYAELGARVLAPLVVDQVAPLRCVSPE